ncbi:MAG: leucine-rich repeat protein, partial [Clostridia bacterium]
MTGKKKLVLSLSVFMIMLVSVITGVVFMRQINKSNTPTSPSENGVKVKPESYTYAGGSIEVLSGTKNINFTYNPAVNTTETKPDIKAYEYVFGNTMGEDIAITLQPLAEVAGADISFYYSFGNPETFETEVQTMTAYEPQIIELEDDTRYVYIYVVVSPSDANLPVNFTTNVTWNVGSVGEISYTVNGVTEREVIVKGQLITEPATPTAPDGYYFDGWFFDSDFSKPATFPFNSHGNELHARFHNFPFYSTTYMTYNNGSYTFIANQEIQNLVLPNMYDDGEHGLAPVTAIEGGYAYDHYTGSIVLPSTLITIGDKVFSASDMDVDISACINLEKLGDYANITAPEGSTVLDLSKYTKLTTIGYSAIDTYGYTTSSLILPQSVKVLALTGCTEINIEDCINLTELGDAALIDLNATELDLSRLTKLTTIGSSAFGSKLESLILPRSITNIDGAFDCTVNLKNVDFSRCVNLESIGERTFYSRSLETIDLSMCSSLTTIGDYAFNNCQNLTSLKLPNSVTTLGRGFIGKTKITRFIMPRGLITLEEKAFSNMYVDNVVISEVDFSRCANLTTIGDQAFKGCVNLTNIDLSACVNLINIGNDVFNGCTNLKKIDLRGCTSLTSVGKGFKTNTIIEHVILPSSITSLDGSFTDCSGLKTVDLSRCVNLNEITNYAFSGCTNLTNIQIPATVTTIGAGAFENCSSIQNLDLEVCNALTQIGDYAFNYCTALQTISLPNSIQTIGESAFSYCANLASVDLPNSLTEIKTLAFANCTSLTSVDFNNSTDLNTIAVGAFNGDEGLKTLDLSTTKITKLLALSKFVENLILPETLTSINGSAYVSSALKSVDFSRCVNLTSVGTRAFDGCEGLTSVDLSNCTKLTAINTNAFRQCSNITELIL